MRNFGDILDDWEDITTKPYGKKQLSKDKRNKKSDIHKQEPCKKVNPMEVWLRRYGTVDHAYLDNYGDNFVSIQSRAHERKLLVNMPADAEIDLHGKTCYEAELALQQFFDSAVHNGYRKLLIIHGKGNHSKAGSVLAPLVKQFLDKNKHAGQTGHPKEVDGGRGSTWVILK